MKIRTAIATFIFISVLEIASILVNVLVGYGLLEMPWHAIEAIQKSWILLHSPTHGFLDKWLFTGIEIHSPVNSIHLALYYAGCSLQTFVVTGLVVFGVYFFRRGH